MKKIGLIFGGIGNESEVSIKSAKNIIKNFDYKKYSLLLIYWHKDGRFYNIKDIDQTSNLSKKEYEINLNDFQKIFDIALLMTHGKYGEDGVLQGILESQKIKYCGCHVLSSALCMDKLITKNLLSGYNIPQVKYESLDSLLDSSSIIKSKLSKIKKIFNLPVYVKPSNSGSSVGITKVSSRRDLKSAIKHASIHDSKILIEQGLNSPREIEIAVLGNTDLVFSQPGELLKKDDFYSYDEKYNLDNTHFQIPAKLNLYQKKEILKIANKVYKICDCKGFARIDFFLHRNKIYLNEINTLPGFTDISMFPMLMKSTGLTYKELINKIIALAF